MEGMSSCWYRYRFADEWRWWNERLRQATGGVDSEALIQSLHGAALTYAGSPRHRYFSCFCKSSSVSALAGALAVVTSS